MCSLCVIHAACRCFLLFLFSNNKWLDPCGVDEIIDNWVGTEILRKIQCHWAHKAHRLLIFTLLSCSFIPLLVPVCFRFVFVGFQHDSTFIYWIGSITSIFLFGWIHFELENGNQNEPTPYTIILGESRKIHVFGLFLAQHMNWNHDDFARIGRKHEWRDWWRIM